MATSSHPSMASQAPMTQMLGHTSLKVAQAFSMIAPPSYLVYSLVLRRGPGFSVRRLMRVSVNSVVLGAGIGAGMGYMRLKNEPAVAVEDRCYRLSQNVTQIRADDYSLIGATISSLLIPTLFLRRAPLPHLVLGGGSIGLGLGVWAHLMKSYGTGEDVKPEGMVGEIPVVGGNK